jgi:Rho GDP-dissociation inhibitor
LATVGQFFNVRAWVIIFFIAVDKTTHMVGSYPPSMEMHSFTTPMEEAPSGMMLRGSYNIKSLFTDDDENEHLKWEWVLEIKKDWE